MPEPQDVRVVGLVKTDDSGDPTVVPISLLVSGEKTITTTGTRERLRDTLRVKAVSITAKIGNTGQVYVGDALITTSTNDGLDAGETLAIEAVGQMDLADIWLDVDTNGEGVDYYAVRV